MSYKQIKWMILFIPTITVALWEYVRHQFLLPYISMDLGNWLTPVFVYIVSITLLTKLFQMLEKMQRELESARTDKAALEAKEQLARELHDGIAQSLFLLSVKAEKLEKDSANDPEQHNENILSICKTIHEVNRYVRQAIANLRQNPEGHPLAESRKSTLQHQILSMVRDIRTPIIVEWCLKDDHIENKEKVELLACVREALINMDKHAAASSGHIQADGLSHSWKIAITDNGKGFEGDPFAKKNKFGLRIMKERCSEMGWVMNMYRDNKQTVVEIRKGGAA
ncbi:two-component sensor histidine kinase [Paenibacillus barcinonensis]|uniref:sensor histidine kinase n=1 Tax=Paenibacillus barcinonensis TaxID=198119 RepID=UPI001C1195D5|nr:histidine kinase [Paenibacillus barcinonensis]MBU5351747.1 two-component sensor histidine kinase [Paenibacillus barcinonensis]